MLRTCKAFSFEAIDVLYTRNVFSLPAAELKTLSDTNQYAHRMASIKILDADPIVIHHEQDAKSTFALIDFLAEKCVSLYSVAVPYTFPTPEDALKQPEPLFSCVDAVKLGLSIALLEPPRYSFNLFLYYKLPEKVWDRFLANTPEGIPIEILLLGQGPALFSCSLSLREAKEEDLIWPASILLGVFEQAFKLYDHDKEHPEEPKQFGRVPTRFCEVVCEMAEYRSENMPRFRQLGDCENTRNLNWLDNLLAMVIVETKRWVHGDLAMEML